MNNLKNQWLGIRLSTSLKTAMAKKTVLAVKVYSDAPFNHSFWNIQSPCSRGLLIYTKHCVDGQPSEHYFVADTRVVLFCLQNYSRSTVATMTQPKETRAIVNDFTFGHYPVPYGGTVLVDVVLRL